jgi:hypothetical protein
MAPTFFKQDHPLPSTATKATLAAAASNYKPRRQGLHHRCPRRWVKVPSSWAICSTVTPEFPFACFPVPLLLVMLLLMLLLMLPLMLLFRVLLRLPV